MVLTSWLQSIQALIGKSPSSCRRGGGRGVDWATRSSQKRRRRAFSAMTASGVVDTEPLESRVLLSATDGSALDQISSSETGGYGSVLANSSGVYSNVSSNYFGTDVFAAASTDDPLTQQYGSAAFGNYLSNGESANGNSFQQAMTDQQNAAAAGGTATGGTSASGGNSSGNGSSGDGSSDAADEAIEPMLPAWKPFVMPAGVEFPQVAQPFESQQDNLFAVQPVGIDSFVNTATITSEVGGVYSSSSENNDAGSLPLTGLTTIVTSEQTYNSPTDWIVHQSVNRNLEQDPNNATAGSTASGDDSASPSGTDSGRQGRNSERTFSITVINGTTTITSLHLSDSFTFESGSIPGESESQDKFSIPQEWVQKALTSVNAGANSPNAYLGATTTGSNEPPVGDAAVDGSGTFVKADYDFSVDVTKSLVTLDDGTPGIQYTLVISFSASFTARTGGQYSIDESDLPPEMLSELAGMTVDAWGDYQLFIGGSVAGNFTATATLPLSVNLANADFTTSFYLGASFQLGGNLNSHVKATKNESSGSAFDGTDEYERVTITQDSPKSGYFGASFWLGFSSDDDASEGDTEDEGEYGAGESDGSDSPASDDLVPGNQSATDLIGQKKSGVQFSLAINGSSSTTDKAKFESKSRTNGSDNDRYYEQILDSDNAARKSDAHFRIELGTEQLLIDFGTSGSDSVDVEQELVNWGYMQNSSMTEYQEVMTVGAYKRTAESHYNFGLVVGGDDPGLKSGGGFTVDEEARDEEHWPTGVYITTETFHNHGGDVESDTPKRHRRVQQYPSENGMGVSIDFDNPATNMSMRPPRSLDDILTEYRDRQTQLARLQAELAETTDPGRQKYLQDAIGVQTAILATLTQEALEAGATQEQLNQIITEAQAAAAGDPIDLQTLDNFNDVYVDSAAPGYFYFLFNPSAMDDDLEDGFYVLMGTGGALLATAGALAAWPVVAGFASTEFSFVVPSGSMMFAGEATLFSGATSTVYTVTGTQILIATLGPPVAYMTREGFEKMGGGNNDYHNSQVPRIMKEFGLRGKRIQRRIHHALHKYLPGERTIEAIREICEEILKTMR
jgi:hypothetical protein